MGEEGKGEEIVYGCYQESQRLVRSQTHKLIYYPKLKSYQLFDLVKDPHEILDQFKNPSFEKIKTELMQVLNQKRDELGDGLLSVQ